MGQAQTCEPALPPPLSLLAIAGFCVIYAGLKIWRRKRIRKQILNLLVLEDFD